MKNLNLVKPSKEYEESFKEYTLLYKRINDDFYYELYRKAVEDFDEYLQSLMDLSKGINLPEGWVPSSTFWLINEEQVVGVVRIRHKEIEMAGHIGCDISYKHRGEGYGTEALRLALQKAKEIGLEEVMVTCRTDNAASRNIIEKNNGKLLGVIVDQESEEELYKFNIKL